MACVAVFVDAGYLFAQGSTALSGSKKPRTDVKLNETAVMAELTRAAQAKSPGCSLLRVYWYDGALSPRLALEHSVLAHMDYIKLRLGFVTGRGQQKGVDSLIVTDLIDLARNRAITDAVMLSGDEDIRIGVQIAQSFGVRVHLVGIAPSRGSQSMQLLRESDTTTEWDAATVSKFLSIRAPAATAAAAALSVATIPILGTVPVPPLAASPVSSALPATVTAALDPIIRAMVATLDSSDITALKTLWLTSRSVPREFDGKLLARSRAELGRDLAPDEKRHVRSRFTTLVQAA
jgi:NYN domain